MTPMKSARARSWFPFAACVFAAASVHSAEYRLERRGDALEAFSNGRRFAVLSPAEDGNWKIDADASGRDFSVRKNRFPSVPRTAADPITMRW